MYKQAELEPDSTTKGRLLTCLRLFDSDEPTRKKYIGEVIGQVTATLPPQQHLALDNS